MTAPAPASTSIRIGSQIAESDPRISWTANAHRASRVTQELDPRRGVDGGSSNSSGTQLVEITVPTGPA